MSSWSFEAAVVEVLEDRTLLSVAFVEPVNYPVGARPFTVVSADLNTDGHLDLAVANRDSANISVLLNNGNGSFAPAVNYPVVGIFPHYVAAGDINGDGHVDLASANQLSNNVSVLLNNGDGSFAAAVNTAVGLDPRSLTVGDFDGDGKDDLAVGNISSNNVAVLLSNGDGTFTPAPNSPFPVGIGPRSVTAGDLDGDGDLDLATANANSNDVSVLLNNGNGSFASAVNLPVGSFPFSVTTADLDGDLDLDLAVANTLSDSVSVLRNNGNGSFAPAANFPAGVNPNSVTAADLDGDGDDDLMIANTLSDVVSVLLNDGNASFNTSQTFAVGSFPNGVAAGDLDADGDIDLVVGNLLDDNVSVLLNNFIPSTIHFVDTRTALAATDFVDWGVLGPADSIVPNPFTITSVGGIQATVSQMPGNFVRFDQSNDPTLAWAGNFALGDSVLWTGTEQSGGGSGPFTVDFGAVGISAAGVQINGNTPTGVTSSFVARITALDATGNTLASFTRPGVTNSNADNSAIFIGIESDTANIHRLVFSLDSTTSPHPTGSFAINRLDFRVDAVGAIGIDFDDIDATAGPVPATGLFDHLGVRFSSEGGPAHVRDLSASNPNTVFEDPTAAMTSLPNLLIGSDPLAGQKDIFGSFVDPATGQPRTASFLGFWALSGPGGDNLSPNVSLSAFDPSGNLIEQVFPPADVEFAYLSVAAPNIASFQFDATPSHEALDDFSFTLEQMSDIEIVSAQLIDSTTVEFVYQTSGNPGDFEVGLFRSADKTFDVGDVQVGDFQPGIPSGDEKTGSFNQVGPVDPTRPYLLVVVDPGGLVDESDETNNVVSFPRPGIVWINRGNDNFETVYGAGTAELARNVVDQAIADWEVVIEDFKYFNSGQFTNSLTIVATSLPRSGKTKLNFVDAFSDEPVGSGTRKPIESLIELDDNAQGDGWFFDPTPENHAEFTMLQSRYAATTEREEAKYQLDFYSLALHEIGHSVGIIGGAAKLRFRPFFNEIGEDTGLFSFSGPTATATLTTGPPGTPPADRELHLYANAHPHDLMIPNLIRGQRRLISDLVADILADAYGYNINRPSTISTFLAIEVNGKLTVQGDPEILNDLITIKQQGADIRVNVNGIVATFPVTSVTTINVLAGDGDDRLIVDFSGGNPIPEDGILYDGGGGDDLFVLQGGTFGTVVYTASGSSSGVVSVDGRPIIYSNIEPIIDTTIATHRVFRIDIPGDQQLRLMDDGIPNNGMSTIDSNGTGAFESVTFASPQSSLSVFAGDGDDTITLLPLDDEFTAFVTVDGENGNDQVIVEGTLTAQVIWKNASGVGVTAGTLFIVGTDGDDHVTVNRQGNGLIKVHANFFIDPDHGNWKTFDVSGINLIHLALLNGDDHATIAGNIDTTVIIDGGAGNDHLNGGNGSNILLGGSGNDVLLGGSGFDLLIGGLGADLLNGNSGDDILIGGSTAYDTQAAALLAILAQWNNGDDYSSRLATLEDEDEPFFLKKGVTVFDDDAIDTLFGSAGLDWFFSELDKDRLRGRKQNEVVR